MSFNYMGHVKQIWYLSPMRAAKVQASLGIHAVSPEPPLLTHTSSESRGTFKQKARSLASLNGWACAVKICHDGMLKDTNLLDASHMTPHTDFLIVSSFKSFEPRHEKTCLREFPTRLKPACSATETSMRLEILVTEPIDITLSRQTAPMRWSDCKDAHADLHLCCSHMT